MNFGPDLILSVVCGAALTSLVLTLAARPLLGILQQEGYSGIALLRDVYRKGNMQRKRLSLLSLSLALLTALFCVCFSFLPAPYPNLVSALPYFGLYALYLFSEKKYALKVPLKPTARAIRLAVCCTLFGMLLGTGAGCGLAALSLWANSKWLYLVRFVPFALFPMLLPLLVCAANGTMKVYEIPHGKKFVRQAEKVLRESNCVKVGITGSFGKTSVKHFSKHLLEGKFRVAATPSSFNTPLGIAKFVNSEGADCDVFLAEMGARKRGDIQELCGMVKPDLGVVTGVGVQHLETFRTSEAVRAEKGVLPLAAEKCVLGRTAADLPFRKEALVYGKDYGAENIELSPEGTRFTLRIREHSARVQTKLLGGNAAEDLAVAAALAFLLGVPFEEIVSRAESAEPVPHRLQKLVSNGKVILDDSYNSNPEGAKDAVAALRLFGGKKIAVTPGLVELGEIEEEENEALGSLLAGLDLVILVGETRISPVRNGYLSAGGESEKLLVVPTLRAAQDLLASHLCEGDAVLFLNDLPDKY